MYAQHLDPTTSENRVEAERLRQEVAALKRELGQTRERHELEKNELKSQFQDLQETSDSLQRSLDNMSTQRNKESRDRLDSHRQVEELRTENSRLRKELASSLDTKLSHLRVPQVSFEQYKELLALTEQLYQLARGSNSSSTAGAGNTEGGGQLPSRAVLDSAKDWTDRMTNAPFSSGSSSKPSAESAVPQQASGQLSHHSKAGTTPQRGNNQSVSHLGNNGASPDRPITSRSSVHSTARGGISPTLGGSPAADGSTNNSGGSGGLVVKESIVEGGKLIKIVQDSPLGKGKQWSLQNKTQDTQFVAEFLFGPLSDVTPMGDTHREERQFRINLYPGETKPFVHGVINGYKMSIRYGPPDENYVPPTSVTDAALLPVLDRVKNVENAIVGQGGTTLETAFTCIDEGFPFMDTLFPPLSLSMARGFEGKGPQVQWEQPQRFLPSSEGEPCLCSETGLKPSNVIQGAINDAWMLSAFSILCEIPSRIRDVFQSTTDEMVTAGLASAWINKHGLWNVVSADLFFPCDENHRLYGASCRTFKDMWVPVLEKILAKCHGSYAALASTGGDTLEALQDITGYPVERFDWKEKESLFSQIHKSLNSSYDNVIVLQSFGVDTTAEAANTNASKRLPSIGLDTDRGYVILGTVLGEQHRLCLIRSGSLTARSTKSSIQWDGPWSPTSSLWEKHPKLKTACDLAEAEIIVPSREEVRKRGGGNSDLIWMEWRDVCHYFDGCGACYIRPDWKDLRIPNRFVGNKASYIIEATVTTRPCTLYIGLHQKDKRGLEPSDPERVYSALLLTVVGSSMAGVWDAIAQSHNGTFWRGRDTLLEVRLEPNERSYYIIPRRYSSDGAKDVVMSFHVEDPDAINLSVQEPTAEMLNAVRFSPVWKFNPSGSKTITQIECQVDKESRDTI